MIVLIVARPISFLTENACSEQNATFPYSRDFEFFMGASLRGQLAHSVRLTVTEVCFIDKEIRFW